MTVGGVSRTSRRPVPQPPPLTPLSSGGLASPSSAPVPGSLDDRLVNPGPEDWKERYQYAALKYNQVVEDYNRLKKLYLNLVGRSGAAGGLVTGAQFYKALRKDTRAEARKLDERYMKGGMRGSELRELERSRDEMRHRDWWLKKWHASSRLIRYVGVAGVKDCFVKRPLLKFPLHGIFLQRAARSQKEIPFPRAGMKKQHPNTQIPVSFFAGCSLDIENQGTK